MGDRGPMQVWLTLDEGKPLLVGEISNAPRGNKIALMKDGLRFDPSDYDDLDEVEVRHFTPHMMDWKRDYGDMLRSKRAFEAEKQRDVPEYANRMHDPRFDTVWFRWPVLLLGLEEYEWVFDLESFEACDTESDTTMLAEEAMAKELRYRLDTAISSAFLGGDSFGAPSSFTSSTTSANSSAIDVEKMNEAMRLMAADGARYVSSGRRYGKTAAMEEIRSYSPALRYDLGPIHTKSLWKISET